MDKKGHANLNLSKFQLICYVRISTCHNLNGQIYACFHVQKRKPNTLLSVIVRRERGGGQFPDFGTSNINHDMKQKKRDGFQIYYYA